MNDQNPFQVKLNVKVQETANQIADMYLERFPRPEMYGVTLLSSECDNEMTFYHSLDPETLNILKECSTIAKQEECSLHEILDSEGHDDIIDTLLDNDTPYSLDLIDCFDPDNTLKFTRFSIIERNEDGEFMPQKHISVELTDDDFKWLLTKMFICRGSYSFNLMLSEKPDLAYKINQHLIWASAGFMYENYNPFLIEMTEIKEIATSILNPFKDVLNLFSSTDPDIRHFAHTKYFGVKEGEIHTSSTASKICNTYMHFKGTKVVFTHYEIYDDIESDNLSEISLETSVILEILNLKEPNDIYPYMVEHFNTPDSFDRIKETLPQAQ